ncbi:putative sporulation protein YtxC [Desulfofundulus thermosubterraneus]|uniref:Putative sporulation protein YtxC n=1 Tax=Desulfofundulus thermosubterraneus DSM 16057 TaxID=1121432 RepID=A0A1M6F7M5_9FIRM|nr:putative sporulation protein YtxC [Desulfofundulus thermosubterraneus]SHI93718.1 putative sporulation protein YtxC [Desulfofundulus thermosubterraneus DSM 16057]
MTGISIGTARHIDLIRFRLGREMKNLEKEGLKVSLKESSAGRFNFVSCQIMPGGGQREDIQAIFRHHIARSLSDLILGQWQQLLLKDMIRENYYYFNEEERQNIFKYALGHLGYGKSGQKGGYQRLFKKKIMDKILDFLRQNNQIIVEGFIRFRLKDYMEELEQAVERAVDDFLMEREYQEFIQLLKYFVEIQESRVELVHVLRLPGGAFRLLDDQKQVLRVDYLENLFIDLTDGEINYEDMLISTLITLAPKHIVIHNADSGQKNTVMETIYLVFWGRVRECTGCPLCQKK